MADSYDLYFVTATGTTDGSTITLAPAQTAVETGVSVTDLTSNDDTATPGDQIDDSAGAGVSPNPALTFDGFVTINGVQAYFVTDTSGDKGIYVPAGTNMAAGGAGDLSTGGTWTLDAPCFLAGTMIATPDGERAVETLASGDLVLTADGIAKPVRWVGRSTQSRLFADPIRALPIRIKAGALGESLPTRDLLVSPSHAMLIDGVLVHAGALVNGTSVVRETGAPVSFTYFHVELDSHSLLLAEGAATESYLDGIDSMAFDNGVERPALVTPVEEMSYPRVKAARQLARATRERLAARAAVIAPDVAVAA
jgi:hypothetical protein